MKINSKVGRPFSEATLMSIARKAKYCRICEDYKGHEEFHKDPTSRDGRSPYCKSCRGKMQYQLQLKKLKARGVFVPYCSECGGLYRKAPSCGGKCKECR